MSDPRAPGIRELLTELTADAARELAREYEIEGEQLKLRARALAAYADTLEATAPADSARAGTEADDLHDGRRRARTQRTPLEQATADPDTDR